MKTFLQFVKEEIDTKKGNYVSIGVVSVPKIDVTPETGKASKDYHVTLMYSKESNVAPETILKELNNKFKDSAISKIVSADCFDSDEYGTSDIVLKIDCPFLKEMFEYLKSLGLKHSYDKFRPHVTLFYDVAKDEAHRIVKEINESSLIGKTIPLKEFSSTTIKKDWNTD